jgi:hypothetical protein
MNHEESEQKLDRVWAAYKESVDVPEASANFTPQLWAKIEARRSQGMVLTGFWRWAAVSITACSLMLGFWLGYASQAHEQSREQSQSAKSGWYLDALQEQDEQLLAVASTNR